MQKSMNISVNGQSQVPPGFRFHPTEEELLQYYLRKKVCYEKIDLDVIRDVDLNKLEPWDIQERCKIGTTPQNDWYFFSHKDKKYPTGTRTNRATAAGFWKATGRDKVIYGNGKRIGMRKTLVFYKGRAPHGQKSDWIMHEYRLEDTTPNDNSILSSVVLMGDGAQEEGWVVCRIFKKKNHLKTLDSPSTFSNMTMESRRRSISHVSNEEEEHEEQQHNDVVFDSCEDDEGCLEQILQQMAGRNCCKEEEENNNNNYNNNNNNNNNILSNSNNNLNGCSYNNLYDQHNNRFFKLPRLESPKSTNNNNIEWSLSTTGNDDGAGLIDNNGVVGAITSWAALDRLVASQLNGQSESGTGTGSGHHLAYGSNGSNSEHHDLQIPMIPTVRSSSSSSLSSLSSSTNRSAHDYYATTEVDLWGFARPAISSFSETLCHVANSNTSSL